MARKGWTYRDGARRTASTRRQAASCWIRSRTARRGDDGQGAADLRAALGLRLPTTKNFLAKSVDEVTRRRLRWYFGETFFCRPPAMHAVEVKSEPDESRGFFPQGRPLAYEPLLEKPRGKGWCDTGRRFETRDDPAPRRGAAAGRAACGVRGRLCRERALERLLTAGTASATRAPRWSGPWWTWYARSRSTWTRRTTSGRPCSVPARRAATKSGGGRASLCSQNLLELHTVVG